MRRLLKIAASILALSLSLSGCGNSGERISSEPVTISIWHYYNGSQQQIFDEMVSQFNETRGGELGIVVEAFSKGNVNELVQSVLDAADKKVVADEVPDIVAAYEDTAYELKKRGMAADLSPYITKDEEAEFIDSYIDEARMGSEDSFIIFPIAKSTECMVLNKTDWDKFESETGTKPDFSTWESIAAIAEKYYNWTDLKTPEPDDGKAFFGRDAMANYMLIGAKQLGVELFQVENEEVTYNLDKDVLRRLWDNYYVPYIKGYYASIGRFRSDDAKTGDIIALVGSTSGASYFPTEVKKNDGSSYPIEAAVYPLPVFEGAKKVNVQQGAGMVVTKSTKEKETAATEFLKWFTEEKQNILFSIDSGYLPVKKKSNDMNIINEYTVDSDMSDTMRDVLEIGVEMTNNYELYTTQAFDNGNEARKILENSLMNKINEDMDKVRSAVSAGKSRQEAAAEFITDSNFDSWYNSLKTDLENVG